MSDTGAPFELPFPTPQDFVRVGPADFQALAERVEDYFLIQERGAPKDANYTLQLADTGRVVPFDSATVRTVTVPANATVAFPIGAVVNVYNGGTANVNVTGAGGVTIRNVGAVPQFQEVSLRKRGTDEWVLAGVVL